MRAVVRQCFADLARRLRTGDMCAAYLAYAEKFPQRYRAIFDAPGMGAETVAVLTERVADPLPLWLGLHGLAHQRAVLRAFPWPADIAERLAVLLPPANRPTTGGVDQPIRPDRPAALTEPQPVTWS
ncbi:hypothetical protein GCM10029964_014280 [Kibdelosporangium lantanae]